MTKTMLIDAAHAEETRVVVVDGQRIEELDFESQSRKQLRGNIYLAKVTRVEPSLQAAFVEYGGNRHGFLAFNEIHPDYYQIPVADREALLREEADDEDEAPQAAPTVDEDGNPVEVDDDDDVMEQELERRRRRLMRRYKIQEVLRRRQIMLVQVVKEERGNKGAALTTYLSLAGRYCVLMPNTARGGGISRKITNAPDRKRLKAAAQSLDVPQGMGLIIRTAGASRTKVEIKRDYEYLLRMWENIRETTLQSIAPALIYAEEDLVKRAIRDMFDKDLEGIVVEGEAGYREARDFMRMLMPSQAKKIQAYREPTPLFVKYRIEDQLAQIHQPTVALKSGGYIVINQTEALVAVDVNSGRSTRERNIEATALKTNLEAAEEAARQLRLRDLAGLIVIDFIDMEESKNNRAVEKKLKDALKDDRARIQVGKISPFGLMEISRQRRRSGVLEGTTHVCEHCQGTGRIRSVESSALAALRTIEVEAAKGIPGAVTIRLPTAIALYVLNEKRVYLARLEQTHDLIITIATDDKLGHTDVVIERTELREGAADRELDYQPPVRRRERLPAPNLLPEPEDVFEPPVEEDEVEEDEDVVDTDVPAKPPRRAETADEADARGRKRRRRRGGRRDDRDDAEPRPDAAARSEPADEDDEDGDVFGATDDVPGESESDARRRRRRRGRRGGRRLREEGRPLDPYAWVHPHGGRNRPHPADDPYAWRDPFAAPHQEDRGFEPRPDRAPLKIVEPALTPVAVAVADPYVWQDGEAPSPASIDPADEPINGRRRERIRRGRGRRTRGPDRLGGVPEAQSPEEIQTAGPAAVDQIEHSIVVEAPSLVPEIAPEAVPAAANVEVEPVVVITAEPPPPPEPDPAEILAPPATPRRGWWRRG